jgi:hypothetical protein
MLNYFFVADKFYSAIVKLEKNNKWKKISLSKKLWKLDF